MLRTVVFYKTDNNRCPVEEFLDSLPPKEAKKITWVLRLLVRLERVPAQYFCKMEGAEIFGNAGLNWDPIFIVSLLSGMAIKLY